MIDFDANFQNAATRGAQPLISFFISNQEFCVDAMAVREIRGWTPSTPLPAAPKFMRGVISLRGKALPIMDMAARLQFPLSEPTSRHAIIVAEIARQPIGLLVDGVSEIFNVTPDMIEPPPSIASSTLSHVVTGIISLSGRVVSVIALDRIFPFTQVEAA